MRAFFIDEILLKSGENTCRMSQKIGKKFVYLNNSLDWILNGSNDENTEFDDLLSL